MLALFVSVMKVICCEKDSPDTIYESNILNLMFSKDGMEPGG